VAGDKTEKPTPKKLDDARKKGQVAKSADVNGSVVLITALGVLVITGPKMWNRLGVAMRDVFLMVKSPDVVSEQGLSEIMLMAGKTILLCIAPIALACLAAGLVASIAQVGIKPMPGAAKPDPKKLNPLTGAKNLFGKRMIFEGGKNTAKVALVAAVAFITLQPKMREVASMVGTPAVQVVPLLCQLIMDLLWRCVAGYVVIAAVDFGWQKHTHIKSLKMNMQEIKDEYKQQSVPQEVKSQQRRRAMAAAQGRMMEDVPTADVVVMNPTHYAVALKYEPDRPAPIVVAKGQDHLALRIRALAEESGVTVVVDPPLARALHANTEIGKGIPEHFFAAIAQLLAYVYRVAERRRRGQPIPLPDPIAPPVAA
jgi:flagellar biosynthetic protein FlhB